VAKDDEPNSMTIAGFEDGGPLLIPTIIDKVGKN